MAVLLLVASACDSADGGERAPGSVAATRAALGEPADGFPNWAERVVWVYTNRARAEPSAILSGCDSCADRDCYGPAAPLAWSHELGRAARFHSQQLDYIPGVLMHDSPCNLVDDIGDRYTPGSCDGDPACACETGAFECVYPSCSCSESPSKCMRFNERASLFGASAVAENIAGFASPIRAVNAFVTEPYDIADCAHRGLDSRGRTKGHRVNLLTKGPAIGVGASSGNLTQDFGFGDAPSKLVAGVHHPETGPSVEMRANWYDDAGPARATVNVDGSCTTMTLERGSPTNGTYLAEVSTGAGCSRYYFHFEDASGTEHFFPSTGAFGIGCADGWTDTRPPRCGCTPACGGRECGPDGCGSSCGGCEGDRTCNTDGRCVCEGGCGNGSDAGVSGGRDGGLPVDAGAADAADGFARDAAHGDARASRSHGAGESSALQGGCACRSTGGVPSTAMPVVALVIALLGLRTSRADDRAASKQRSSAATRRCR